MMNVWVDGWVNSDLCSTNLDGMDGWIKDES